MSGRRRQNSILVVKFGGTSLGDEGSVRQVMGIVRAQHAVSPVVTVVSAMGGVTDGLLGIGRHALEGRERRIETQLERLRLLHERTFLALGASEVATSGALRRYENWIRTFLEDQFREIREIVHGILLLRELSERTKDRLVSYGEILSSNLLAKALEYRDPVFVHSDARRWIVAEDSSEGPAVNFDRTEKLIQRRLLSLVKRGRSPIVPGFICSTSTGVVSTLGRNGSDYSASIVGAALPAREIWIYTDVSGIMTADPSLVTEAVILPQVSYEEAAEMSYFGARVLHPKTMIPAVLRRIPIRIRNTFEPEAPGTLITDRSVRQPVVKTVTSVRDLALMNIQGSGMVGIPGVSSRIFRALAQEEISVMMISQSSSEHTICLVIPQDKAVSAGECIRKEFEVELRRSLIERVGITKGIAIVSVIGAGMRGTPGISGRFFDALGRHRINIVAIAQGSSEYNISAAIAGRNYRHAVQALHTAFGLTHDLNIFVFGCGNIGRTLLRQIDDSRRLLNRKLGVNLKVLGVANTKHWSFFPGGMPAAELEHLGSSRPLEELPGAEARPSAEQILRRIAAAYKSDVVVVDATGDELAPVHIESLRKGFHVVTANKKPLTSPLKEYLQIQKLCKKRGLSYQYEATFGAGLPLLFTLQDLINTGDQILKIEGCLSGTLGFLCSQLDAGVSFSRALKKAMTLGYTEPDPRDDLSGTDVARKALIIARELGFSLELGEVQLRPFVPQRFFRARTVAAFVKGIASADKELAAQTNNAKSDGNVLRFVAEITEDGCRVGLKTVPRESPIGRLSGPDNMLVFQTQRYFENPLVIQGPGAGAVVTAAGVLSDILKIARSK